MGIELEKICKSYNGKLVLSDFSLGIPCGTTLNIMGSTGCGKTTLIHILAGIVRPDSGSIRGMKNKRVSAVFQENRLIPRLSALENVTYVMAKNDKKQNEKLARSLLSALSISETGKNATELSGGMKRRVAIARALSIDFDVLILDEAFKGLDITTKQQVIAFIREKTQGKTVISVTHEDAEAKMLGGEIILLSPPTPSS